MGLEVTSYTDEMNALVECIADTLCVDDDDVTPNASLVDDLAADSLDIHELAMNVEELFSLAIPEDFDLSKLATVQNWHDHIMKTGGKLIQKPQKGKAPKLPPETKKAGMTDTL